MYLVKHTKSASSSPQPPSENYQSQIELYSNSVRSTLIKSPLYNTLHAIDDTLFSPSVAVFGERVSLLFLPLIVSEQIIWHTSCSLLPSDRQKSFLPDAKKA